MDDDSKIRKIIKTRLNEWLVENNINKMNDVDKVANKIFSINYNNILNSEDEFCIGIYEKNGKILTSNPIIGNDVEVEVPTVDGILLALVHTHFDGLELSVWDEEIGQEYAKNNNQPFRIYVIGFNEDDDLVMTYEEFDVE
jgi:hypothetical protein